MNIVYNDQYCFFIIIIINYSKTNCDNVKVYNFYNYILIPFFKKINISFSNIFVFYLFVFFLFIVQFTKA